MTIDRKLFGKKLHSLRTNAGLSQSGCADALGVTNKAVSKWETGSAYPTMNTIVKIADLYNIPLSELFASVEDREDGVFVLAVAGGPCAGKSVAIHVLREQLERRGWKVFTVSEAATSLIDGGCMIAECKSQYEFQQLVFEKELSSEDIVIEAARKWVQNRQSASYLQSGAPQANNQRNPKAIGRAARAIVLCDRATPDNAAFLSDSEFSLLTSSHSFTRSQLYERYDGVIRLESAAHCKGSYTQENNPARSESVEGALESDERVKRAWAGHDNIVVVHAADSFNEKLLNTCARAFELVGETPPESINARRTILIKKPNEEALATRTNGTSDSERITFLEPRQGKRLALIARKRNGFTRHSIAVCQLDLSTEIGFEEEIDANSYNALASFADPALKPVERKNVRFCLNGTLVEVHFYGFYPYIATCDMDVPKSKPLPELPPYLTFVRETTDTDTFALRHIARQLAQGRL